MRVCVWTNTSYAALNSPWAWQASPEIWHFWHFWSSANWPMSTNRSKSPLKMAILGTLLKGRELCTQLLECLFDWINRPIELIDAKNKNKKKQTDISLYIWTSLKPSTLSLTRDYCTSWNKPNLEEKLGLDPFLLPFAKEWFLGILYHHTETSPVKYLKAPSWINLFFFFSFV